MHDLQSRVYCDPVGETKPKGSPKEDIHGDVLTDPTSGICPKCNTIGKILHSCELCQDGTFVTNEVVKQDLEPEWKISEDLE